jgi:hypothetical protein
MHKNIYQYSGQMLKKFANLLASCLAYITTKKPPSEAYFFRWHKQPCKSFLAGEWAFSVAIKTGTHIFDVATLIPADIHAVVGANLDRRLLMPQWTQAYLMSLWIGLTLPRRDFSISSRWQVWATIAQPDLHISPPATAHCSLYTPKSPSQNLQRWVAAT